MKRGSFPSKRWAGAVIALACSVCSTQAPAEMPTANRVLHGTVTVGEKQVPLPQGAWIVAASTYERLPDTAPAAAAAAVGVVLFQVERGRVDAFIQIQTNAVPAPGDWGLARECVRSDIHHAAIHGFQPGAGGSCSYVNHVVMAKEPQPGSAWETASRLAAARGWALPPVWLMAGFRFSGDEDALDVRFFFNPSRLPLAPAVKPAAVAPPAGLMPATLDWFRGQAREIRDSLAPPPQHDPRWEENEWAPARVGNDGARQQAIAGLVRWSDRMREPIRLGMHQEITGMPSPAMPWVEDGAPISPETALRLRRLEDVRNAGAISEERYRELRDLVLREGAGAREEGKLPWELSLWKTGSWRALGSSLDLLISYIFTGSLGTAGGITVVGGAVNSAAYYGHELAWSLLGRGLPPPMKIVEFPGVGLDG